MTQQHINLGTPPGGNDGDTIRTAMGKVEANFNDLYSGAMAVSSFKNLLINGDGRINQRAFAGGALAANTYGYDRWRALGTASSMTVGTATISLQGTNCQIIEAPDLANATVTVSVTNPSGPITVALQPDGRTATSATGVIPAGVGNQKVTLAVPATLTGNVFLLLTVAGMVTIDGPSKRAGIQAECGSTATPFERRLYPLELMLCQRYFEKRSYFFTAYNLGGSTIDVDVPFAVVKRVPPTIAWPNADYANCSGITTGAIATDRFIPRVTVTSTGSATFNGIWTATAEL